MIHDPERTGAGAAAGDAQARIRRILDSATQLADAGEPFDSDALLQAHPDLMPELGRRLRDLKIVMRGKHAASVTLAQDEEAVRTSPDQDLQCLADELRDYKVTNRIHRGGQGSVYRALQVATGREVAIKVLSGGPFATERQLQRFVREIKLTARLQHPHIVTIYGSGIVRGLPYYVMEYVEGIPITDFAVVEGLSARKRVELFVLVLQAVSKAHQQTIIHRDLKPSNILVDTQGVPHVLDFGLAKALDVADDSDQQISVAGNVVGTLPYLSPEQAEGREETDVRSDLYSLGIVLFELLTGDFPYPVEGDRPAVRDNIIHRRPRRIRECLQGSGGDGYPPPAEIDDDLEAIMARALAKDPRERDQSADAFAADLERLLRGEAVQARADHGLYMLRKTMRKYRTYLGAMLAFAALAAGAAFQNARSAATARRERDNARMALRVAQGTLEQVVGEVDESISPLAGGAAVRDRLLLSVQSNFDQLKPLISLDGALADIAGSLAEKRGDLAVGKGQRDEAAQLYAEALSRLNVGDGATIEALLAAERLHRKMAGVVRDWGDHFDAAAAVGRRALVLDPGSDDARLALCKVYGERGRSQTNAGWYTEALASFGKANKLAGESGSIEERWQNMRADLLEWESYARRALGNAVAARALLEESIRLRNALWMQRPYDVELSNRIATSAYRLAEMLYQNNDIDGALLAALEAIELGEKLAAMEPGVSTWKLNLYRAYAQAGKLYRDRSEYDQATRYIDKAHTIMAPLAAAEPDDQELQSLLGDCLMTRGKIHMESDAWEAAFTDFQAALEIRECIVEQAKVPAPLMRSDVASTLDYLGWVNRWVGMLQEALKCYRRSMNIREQLCTEEPAVVDWQMDLVVSVSKKATWLLTLKTPEGDQEARPYLVDAIRRLDELESKGLLAGQERSNIEARGKIAYNLNLIERRAARRAIDAVDPFLLAPSAGAVR